MGEHQTNNIILVVEDEQSLLTILQQEFETAGFKVLAAQNGDEGLQLALKEHPSVMLVDILMPKMDGLTMLQKIRQDEQGKKIPAIILTNVTDMETTAKALESDVYEYLIKSDWEPKRIVDMVKEKFK